MITASKSAYDVIVCGSLHLDIMVEAGALPRIDETVVGSAWGMKCGGKGGNQAVMAARMGACTAMIGRVGTDDFGARLTANLEKAGVEHSAVGIDSSAGSGMSVALLEAAGEYGAVIVSGANLALDPQSCAAQWHGLGGATILVLQNEIPEAVNISVARAARASGALVLLNAAPARAMSPELLGLVDVLIVNRIEAEILSGCATSTRQDIESATDKLAGLSPNIVLTLGAEGLVLKESAKTLTTIPAVPVKMISSHGAGDCFVGALATGLAGGLDLQRACIQANAAAAKYVSMTETEWLQAI